jgi:methyl-accepting chemotaxis protein
VRVHRVESTVTGELTAAADRLYNALNSLALAIEGGPARAPENAAEWATAASEIINRAMMETRELAQTGRAAIEQASDALADVQQGGRDFINTFTDEVRKFLVTVQKQNEAAIKVAAEQSQQTLRVLVDEQTRPLIQQLREMLGRFGEQQAAFRSEIVNLAQDVTSIRTAADELAEGALGLTGAAASLARIADSEREIASQVTTSLEGITTAAAAMGEVRDVLIADVHSAMPAMTSGVTEASQSLAQVQRNLAETTGALTKSAAALGTAAAELRLVSGSLGRPRSRFWPPWPFR